MLSVNGSPLAGKSVAFTLGGTPVGEGITNASGLAELPGVSLDGFDAGMQANAVAASFAGDAGFFAIDSMADLVIQRAGTTTSIVCEAEPLVFSGSPQTPCTASATGAGGLDASLAVTYSNNVNAGTATASASYAETANHTGSSDSATFTIGRASQTIQFDVLPDRLDGDPDFGVTAQASTGLPVTFSASGNCTVAGQAVHLAGAGSCTVTASQAGDDNYEDAPDVPRMFAVKADTDHDGIADEDDEDDDGDGIADAIDRNRTTGADESRLYSNDYRLDAYTFGTIVDRAVWFVELTQDVTGRLRATVESLGSIGSPMISACAGLSKQIRFDFNVSGESALWHCGPTGTVFVTNVGTQPVRIYKDYYAGSGVWRVVTTIAPGDEGSAGSPIRAAQSNGSPITVRIADDQGVERGGFAIDPGEEVDVEVLTNASGNAQVAVIVLSGTVDVTVFGQTQTMTAGGGAKTFSPDAAPPVIGAAPDLVVEATSAAGAVVTFNLPSVTDDVDPAPVVTVSPGPGTAFPMGATVVTVTATDAAGHLATSTFTITVVDTTPPALSVPADLMLTCSGVAVDGSGCAAGDDPALAAWLGSGVCDRPGGLRSRGDARRAGAVAGRCHDRDLQRHGQCRQHRAGVGTRAGGLRVRRLRAAAAQRRHRLDSAGPAGTNDPGQVQLDLLRRNGGDGGRRDDRGLQGP
ncbi:MAG: hypothetical protein A3F70_08655 [Acidobacteria bacterium RIFCSPLOWO2_12_FULL_67_14]|nr:MAG: hypothetical protein A3F70_08655 [Acidobacteria bacterium RIFCSPLOWO2_12_FULL_67_14]